MQTPKKEVHFFFFSVCCIAFNCSWQLIMFDKKQKSCVKRIHLVTDDGWYDGKAFYTVKIVFYSSSMDIVTFLTSWLSHCMQKIREKTGKPNLKSWVTKGRCPLLIIIIKYLFHLIMIGAIVLYKTYKTSSRSISRHSTLFWNLIFWRLPAANDMLIIFNENAINEKHH